jgi:hypothetical protein
VIRPLGAVVAGLAAVLAVLPALAWYAAEAPARRVTATGFEGAGALWTLPALAALALAGGLAAALAPAAGSGRRARLAGAAVAAAGAISLAWSLRAVLDPPVALTILDGGERVPVDAPIVLEPAALATPAVAAALMACGALLALVGRRR